MPHPTPLVKYFWQRFSAHTRGNVAVIMALSIVPLVIVGGGGTDMVNLMRTKSELQDAADAAVLRASLTSSLSDEASKAAADATFDANFSSNLIADADVTQTLSRTTVDKVTKNTYAVSANFTPMFMGMIPGIDDMTLSAEASAQAEVNPFELVFVLDTTGSMAGTRMTNLKSSVNAVLDSLVDTSGNNSIGIKVGVVPFNLQVRMATATDYAFVDYTNCYSRGDLSSSNSSYINYYACQMVWKAYNKVCQNADSVTNCKAKAKSKLYYKTVTSGGVTYYYASTTGYEASGTKYKVYTYAVTTYVDATTNKWVTYSETTTGLTPTATNTYNAYTNYSPGSNYKTFSSSLLTGITSWEGCLSDRNKSFGNFDTSAASMSSDTPDSYYIAVPCAYTTTASRDMTTDITGTKTYVTGLSTGGNTNITVGVQFGMEILSPETPYTNVVDWGDDEMDKYMILVTDGENTQNRWSSSESTINARTALACQAAKDKGIILFVVRVEDGNSSLLQDCATKTEYYYNLSSASQLTTAMQSIFKQIGKLRLVE